MDILILGTEPFVSGLAQWCEATALTTAEALTHGLHRYRIIVEAETTSTELKRAVLQRAATHLAEDGLLLTCALNTSVTQAASWVPWPERVAGFGLLPPLAEQGTVEVARGLRTSQAALEQAIDFWRSLGRQTTLVADGAGLVRARIVACIINEALSALMEGIASAEDIDQAMRLGTNYPLGPLAWGDAIGLDTVLGVMAGLHEEWGDDRYRPSPLLKRMVLAGRLGKKSGEGCYRYA